MTCRLTLLMRLVIIASGFASSLWPATALADPVPDVLEIGLPSGEIRPGQEFDVFVRAINRGDPALNGSISVSFPDRPGVRVVSPSSVSTAGSHAKVFVPGDKVFNFDRNESVPAEYPLAEWFFEDPWPRDQERFLALRVTAPQSLAALKVNVRVAVRSSDRKLINFPANSFEKDQQGFPVVTQQIRLLQPSPTPRPTNTPLPSPSPLPTWTPVPSATAASNPTVPATTMPPQAATPAVASLVVTVGAGQATSVAPPAGTTENSGPSGSSSLPLLLAVIVAAGIVPAVVILATRRSGPRAPSPIPHPWTPSAGAPPIATQPPPVAPPPTAQARPPDAIPAGYELVGEPKKGGMALVYRALEPALNRYVALKVLSPALGADPSFIERFQDEARNTASLDHPNIVTVYRMGQQDGSFFIAMRYVNGGTLDELLSTERLSLERVVSIVSQLADALDYAHGRGVIHRDIKPANVMIESGDRVTLTDFGIARLAEGTHLTRTGMFMGTPDYMSPEQIKGEKLDARSDLYSLGVVLYQILTGRVPFQADTPVGLIHAHVYLAPAPPRQLNPSLSPAIEAVVLKALAKEPGQRFQSGRELVQALRAAAASPEPVL